MSATKRERNSSMIQQQSGNNHFSHKQTMNGNLNGRQRASSSPTNPSSSHSTQYYGNKEKGIVEKLLNSYGFVECATSGNRVFFHYSEYEGDPNNLIVGDCLEFVLTTDPRNNKPIAIKLCKLPSGSVAIETISDEECIGQIEIEAKPSQNGDFPDPSTFGRVSYDKNGEFFFLPFSINDIAKGEQVRKGDHVQFLISTNKRTGSLKARKIRYMDPLKQAKRIQGIVSALKESFGFIERADVVAEIFFHYTEYDGNINDVIIGDDVEFMLQDRYGKEIAITVKKLEPGSVVFEDISEKRYRGHVIKSVNTKNGMNSSLEGHLTGMIEYQGTTDTHEVLFGDRDMEDDIILEKGDVVEFNVSTDRRDKLERAVNIKLISVSVKNGQTRDEGVVSSLKDGFGFIRCAEKELSIFFHFSEVVEQSHVINIGDEVEFTIENDTISQRQHATRIRFLPKGSVSFETVSKIRHVGVIHQEAPERNTKSSSKYNRENEYGIIKCFLEGKETDIYYRTRDCRPRDTPHYRDKVEFVLVTKKANQQCYARDVSMFERKQFKMQNGYVCALKDTYGFIESDDHENELFFHYSEFDGEPSQLELGDYVKYVETRKSDKRSAESVCKVLAHTIVEEVLPTIYDGAVTRPMRIMDPGQSEYEGLIHVVTNNSLRSRPGENGDEKTAPVEDLVYRFGITSILEKKESLQQGDKVTFQVCIDGVSKKKRATNVTCKRSLLRGKIESIKGQFGFISYESNDGKSVFFHMSEVQNDHGKELQHGDEVRFVIVQNHKNAKKSAIRVQKIVDERPEHLTRRRSNKFSECQAAKFFIMRQPRGPDGSNGFKLDRDQNYGCAELSNKLETAVIAEEEMDEEQAATFNSS